MRMGIPKVITADQGKEFNNFLNKELTNKLHSMSVSDQQQESYMPFLKLVSNFCYSFMVNCTKEQIGKVFIDNVIILGMLKLSRMV